MGECMKPAEALSILFRDSNLAPVNKIEHMRCEQAKAILDLALTRLAELSKNKQAKTSKGGKK